jgi:hypothetical protein
MSGSALRRKIVGRTVNSEVMSSGRSPKVLSPVSFLAIQQTRVAIIVLGLQRIRRCLLSNLLDDRAVQKSG